VRTNTQPVVFFNLFAEAYDFLTQQRFWRAQIADAIQFMPPPEEIHTLVDVGCGPGASAFVMAQRLPNASVLGVDIAGRMVKRAQKNHRQHHPHLERLRFQHADAANLPLEDDAVDVVFGHSFLYLVPRPKEVLEEIHRVLRPGGRVIFLEPHFVIRPRVAFNAVLANGRAAASAPTEALRFWTSMVTWRLVSGGVGRMSAKRLHGLLKEAGFADLHTEETLGSFGVWAAGTKGAL
jgi:ubiquinone/menaquinone biosynthesis C-methylase UbiE